MFLKKIIPWLAVLSQLLCGAGILSAGEIQKPESRRGLPKQFFGYRSFMPEFEVMKKFRAMGIDTFTLMFSNGLNSVGSPYTKYQPIWVWEKEYDMAMVDKQFQDLFAAVPDAKVICYIDLNPPTWWAKRGYSRRDRHESYTDSGMAYGSNVWREDVAHYFQALLKHLNEKYGDRIEAYLYAAGPTTEWFDRSLGTESNSRIAGWRKWNFLRGKPIPDDIPPFVKRYAGDADVIPSKTPNKLIFDADKGVFAYKVGDGLIRTPEKSAESLDYWHFTNEEVADTVLYMAKKAREVLPESARLGTMFGYTVFCGYLFHASQGHLDYERVFDSPDLDMIVAPSCYLDRKMGGGGGSMIPVMSLHRRGLRMLDTCDHRTFTSRLPWRVGGSDQPWKNGAEVAAGIKRETAYKLITGTSTWWFDMWGGWWDSPEAMETIAKSKKIFDVEGNKPFDDTFEVLRVVDAENMYYVNDLSMRSGFFTGALKMNMNRAGVPYGVCSINDLDKMDLSKVKVLLFTHPFNLDGEKMKMLRERVLKDGRTAIWLYGPGIIKDGKWNPENVEKVCGTKFKTKGVSTVKMDGWNSVYAHTKDALTPDALRKIYAEAGVHIWSDKPRPVYANSTLAAVHTAEAEEIEFKFPRKCELIEELYTGETFRNTDTVKIKTSGPDTKFYRYK